jgi:hypothetical protein
MTLGNMRANRVMVAACVSALVVRGCTRDKTGDLAACEVQSIHLYPKEQSYELGSLRRDYITACMSSKGYDFTAGAKGCSPVTALAIQPDCYTAR